MKYNNNINNNMNVQLMLRYSGQQNAAGGVEPRVDQWASLDFQFNSSYRSEKLNLVYAFPFLPYAFPLLICITAFLHTKESLPAYYKWIVVYMLITVLFTDRNKSLAYWLACSLLTLNG